MSRLVILSDIHGNLSALDAVISDFNARNYNPQGIVLLGDIINYGMRPNDVISRLKELSENYNIITNIYGNHEKALIDWDTSHFSTERGKRILDYTRNIISRESLDYINHMTKEGWQEHEINGKKILFVHGSYSDPFWGKLNDTTSNDEIYAKYDFVISGHSHIPHMIERFFNSDNSIYRNKKRTVFINPGSVGQPRNHNPKAQYLYAELDNEVFHFNTVSYNVANERKLFDDSVDPFYSNRLTLGI